MICQLKDSTLVPAVRCGALCAAADFLFRCFYPCEGAAAVFLGGLDQTRPALPAIDEGSKRLFEVIKFFVKTFPKGRRLFFCNFSLKRNNNTCYFPMEFFIIKLYETAGAAMKGPLHCIRRKRE